MKIDTSLDQIDNVLYAFNASLSSSEHTYTKDELDITLPELTAYINPTGRVLNTSVLISNKSGHNTLKRDVRFYYDRLSLEDIQMNYMGKDISVEVTDQTQFTNELLKHKTLELLHLAGQALELEVFDNSDDAKMVKIKPKDGDNNYLYTDQARVRYYLSIV